MRYRPDMTDETDALSSILNRLRLTAGLFTEATFCGAWAVDTSGARMATFHLIQSGDSWLQLDGEEPRRLRPGDFVLFPRDAKHLITSSEKLPKSVIVNEYPALEPELPTTEMLCGYFEFRSRMVWPILDSLPEVLVIDLHQSPLNETRALLQLLLNEAKGGQPGRSAVIDLLVEVLFVHALRCHIASGTSAGLLKLFAEPRLGSALNCIHAEPGRGWSVASLADVAGMSRASFSQKFKDAVNDTPMNYLGKWRMQVAIEALTTTEQSVAQIADDVGYGSEAAFRHAFRNIVGATPGDVRRQHANTG
ncbi:MAG: AraC family transcriptional regulator [Pseudomonadota bacterium]